MRLSPRILSGGRARRGPAERKERIMEEKKQRKCFRLTKAERASIERALDANASARSMARDLGRSPASVVDEARRNRTVAKGPGKGERVEDVPEDACARLLGWPWVCNGCRLRRYHCSKKRGCEYSAARSQALADGLLREARRGVNARELDFEDAMGKIRADVARGLSPAQIAHGRAAELKVHPSTACRWVAAGYGGMSNAELRRKVGYKPRKERAGAKETPHGAGRSYRAFSALPEESRAMACEADTVIGRSRDSQCVLTLYLHPSKVQLCLLLPEKTSSAAAAALDSLETALGKKLFQRLFGLVLTDNGCEFSDTEAIEKSVFEGAARCQVYYCDVRQSQQKGGCERNHVELRKLLPKGRGISFDDLAGRDMAVLMSQLNSEPRPSLMGLSPLALLRTALGRDADSLMDALGIEEVRYEKLDLTTEALNRARRERGEEPLVQARLQTHIKRSQSRSDESASRPGRSGEAMPSNPSERPEASFRAIVFPDGRNSSAWAFVLLAGKALYWLRVFGWLCRSTIQPTHFFLLFQIYNKEPSGFLTFR